MLVKNFTHLGRGELGGTARDVMAARDVIVGVGADGGERDQ